MTRSQTAPSSRTDGEGKPDYFKHTIGREYWSQLSLYNREKWGIRGWKCVLNFVLSILKNIKNTLPGQHWAGLCISCVFRDPLQGHDEPKIKGDLISDCAWARPISGSIWRRFRGHADPGMGQAPRDPDPGQSWIGRFQSGRTNFDCWTLTCPSRWLLS